MSTRHFAENHELKKVASTLPGYSILRTLGRGGFGAVFLAASERLKTTVAIKAIPYWDDNAMIAVRAAALRMASLRHPAIVSVYEVRQIGTSRRS